MLEQLGFVGWDRVEPTILSAMFANYPILMVGKHGSFKTMGAEILAKSALGSDSIFGAYDTPNLQFDDLIGFPNPKQFDSRNEISTEDSFIKTPFNIWNKDSALFDEINRANPFIQGKLNELIRNRTIMGLPTKLKLVFAAANPPDIYSTMHIPLALASRFSIIEVPSLNEMDSTAVEQILAIESEEKAQKYYVKPLIRDLFAKVSNVSIESEERKKIVYLMKDIIQKFKNGPAVIIEGRTLRAMYKLLISFFKLNAAGMNFNTARDLPNILDSILPEGFSIVNRPVKKADVRAILNNSISQFSLNTLVHNLVDYLKTKDAEDPIVFHSECLSRIQYEKNPSVLKKAICILDALSIDFSLKKNLINAINVRKFIIEETLDPHMPVNALIQKIQQSSIFNLQ